MLQALARPQKLPDIVTNNASRVLLVEDDRTLAYLLRRVLSDEHCHVDLAHGAHQTVEIVERAAHDLMVIDQSLSHPSGLDLCRQLRASGVNTPVLMLTPGDAVDDRFACLRAGASDYISKPFSMHDFLERSGSMARGKKSEGAARLKQRAGDLVLDPVTREVWHAGCPIALNRSEFILLDYFMRHSGRVLTRRQIIDHVWSYEQEKTANMVDGCVRSLQDKIEATPSKVHIKPVLSAGYVLDV